MEGPCWEPGNGACPRGIAEAGIGRWLAKHEHRDRSIAAGQARHRRDRRVPRSGGTRLPIGGLAAAFRPQRSVLTITERVPALKNQRFGIPLTSTLLAFEAAARNASVSRAAAELNTSQSAISRHLRRLEDALGMKLFARTGRGIALTDRGEAYFVAVQRYMKDLETTAYSLRTQATRLTLACTSAISTLVVLPVFSRLKRSLGENVSIEVAVYDGSSLEMPHSLGPRMPDIVLDGAPTAKLLDEDAVKILDEEIVPVASPEFAERFGSVLDEEPGGWSAVPRLEMSPRDRDWASWNFWFEAQESEVPDAPVDVFEDYAHLLRAAAEGEGLAIGRNGFLHDYVVDGRLLPIGDRWLRTGLAVYAFATEGGKRNPASESCMRELAKLVAELRVPPPSAKVNRLTQTDVQLSALGLETVAAARPTGT
ncbi:MAG: LysR family transcriptional regulator [Defluviicoccus sp.]|nr:LysR family transcriptional regulator [Defluviicoccus sp.]